MSTLHSSYDDFIVSPAEQLRRARERRQRLMAVPAAKPRPKPAPVEPTMRWDDKWDNPLRPLVVSYGGEIGEIDEAFLSGPTRAFMRDVLAFATEHFGAAPETIRHGGKTKRIAAIRHVVVWMMRELTGQSYPQIGKFLGGRDHSGIIHSCHVVRQAIHSGADLGRMANDAVDAFEAWRLKHDHPVL